MQFNWNTELTMLTGNRAWLGKHTNLFLIQDKTILSPYPSIFQVFWTSWLLSLPALGSSPKRLIMSFVQVQNALSWYPTVSVIPQIRDSVCFAPQRTVSVNSWCWGPTWTIGLISSCERPGRVSSRDSCPCLGIKRYLWALLSVQISI